MSNPSMTFGRAKRRPGAPGLLARALAHLISATISTLQRLDRWQLGAAGQPVKADEAARDHRRVPMRDEPPHANDAPCAAGAAGAPGAPDAAIHADLMHEADKLGSRLP